MQEHTGPVASISAQQLQDGTTLLVSSASDGQLCVWGSSSDTGGGWELLQKITFGIQLQLCADVTHMPGLPGWWHLLLAFSCNWAACILLQHRQHLLQTTLAPPKHNILRRLGKDNGVPHKVWCHFLTVSLAATGICEFSIRMGRRRIAKLPLPERRDAATAGAFRPLCRLLLACGGVDGAVRLLVRPPGASEFVQACKLVGHQDWVHSVAFRHTDASGGLPGAPHPRPWPHAPGSPCSLGDSLSVRVMLLGQKWQRTCSRIAVHHGFCDVLCRSSVFVFYSMSHRQGAAFS